MNDRFLRPIVGALALLLSGCFVTSEHPLSDPKDAQPDPALAGEWRSTIHADEPPTRIRFDRRGRGLIAETTQSKPANPSERFFVTKTAKASYLNITGSTPHKGGYFLRYQVSADGKRLTFWMPKTATFRRAVTKGKLKGVIDNSQNTTGDDRLDGVHLSDSPAAILQFMESQRAAAVFEVINVYRRVR